VAGLAITLSQTSQVGNGVNTAFATGFSFTENSDLVVEVAPSGGAFVTKVLGVDYNVTGAGADEPGGTVTFLAAPANLSTVRITRNTPRTQPLSLVNQFDLLPESLEGAFNRTERQVQELERRMAAEEAGSASVTIATSRVTDGPFVCADPQAARNVACVGTPTGVMLVKVQDNTDGLLVHNGLGMPDFSGFVLNQFTARYVPGLVPGHSYTLTYLVFTT
jgi:hypothetical protein